ncbi:MAG: hypothetical protein ACI3T9_00915 [Romboutsia timonensis]
MLGIGKIEVNGSGKSSEEIKKEIMEQVGKQVDEMMKAHKETKEKIEKKSKKEATHLHLLLDEAEDKSGFGCSVDVAGDFENVMTMLTVGVSNVLHQVANDKENEYDPDLLVQFITALIAEYGSNAISEGEDEDGEE